MPSRKVRTYTIETRGGAVVLMSWSDEISAGPVEVRQFVSIEAARSAAQSESSTPLSWREARGDEKRHGVVTAADLP
jgi:hypothetical protein